MIELSKHFSKLSKKCRFKGCVFPDKSRCTKKVIKAHSIQKNRILNYLAENGMLTTFDPRRSFITGDFEEVGINDASTFFGFCNYHDGSIFSDIENKDYTNEPVQNLLYSYRACVREYIIKRFAYRMDEEFLKKRRNPTIYTKLWADYQDLKDLVKDLDKFHKELLKPKENRNYCIFTTKVYRLSYESLIAVNSTVSIPFDFKGRIINDPYNYSAKIMLLFLNIFPQNKNTYILLSCFSNIYDKFKALFSQINKYNENQLENLFSIIIISHCENSFFSPRRWKKIVIDERKKVVSIYQKTLLGPTEKNYLTKKAPINLFRLLRK